MKLPAEKISSVLVISQHNIGFSCEFLRLLLLDSSCRVARSLVFYQAVRFFWFKVWSTISLNSTGESPLFYVVFVTKVAQ